MTGAIHTVNDFNIRPAEDSDADALIALVDHCFQEYADQGVVIDLDDLDADLHAIRTNITQQKGDFWVVEPKHSTPETGLIACIGVAPIATNQCELKRLYMHADYRGQGLADHLVKMVEHWVLNYGANYLSLWSDTRFTRAHRFYEKKGYVRQPLTRDLNDISNTTEYEYIKQMT